MFKHHLAPFAAVCLLGVGCSQLKSFAGASDDAVVASASWNESSATDSSWSQEEGSNSTVSNPQSDDFAAAAAFPLEAEQGSDGVYDFAQADEASATPSGNTGSTASYGDDPAAELYGRVENLQATTATLLADVKQLNKQFNALLTSNNANATHAQATDRFIESASGQISSFGDALASLDSQITSVATEVSATRSELRDVKNDVRGIGSATTTNLTPVIEQSYGSTNNWFKITLAAVVAGFVGLSFFCWKAFNGNRGNATSGR